MTSQAGEKELARLCSKGDNEARRELYTRYSARVLSLCRRYVADDDEARDRMHDVMIKAFDRISRYEFKGEGSLWSWLARMAVNLCLDRIRSNRKWKMESIDGDTGDIPEPDVQDVRTIPRDVLMEMIARLPDSRRMVFNMYCIDGIPHKEIARMMGITEGASTSMLTKAKKTLAAEINDYLRKHQ